MPTNQLAPPDMPWLIPRGFGGPQNQMAPPLLNYAASPDAGGQTQGSAIAETASNVAQAWPSVEEQRRMLQPLPGWQGTAVDAAKQWADAILMGTTAPGGSGIRAYHGSPHDFERFDTSKIGTGEGAQAYGHGLYFAEGEGVARQYRDVLASRSETGTPEGVAKFWANMQGGYEGGISHLEFVQRQIDQYPNNYPAGEADKINQAIQYLKSGGDLKPAGGHMYEVNIGADPEHMLQWDQTIGTHPPAIRDKLLDMGYGDTQRGSDVYLHMARGKEGDVGASKRLQDAGIPGISYFDAGSRGAGTGTKNHVVFDAATIDILRKYGLAGLMLGGGAAAAGSQQQPPSQ